MIWEDVNDRVFEFERAIGGARYAKKLVVREKKKSPEIFHRKDWCCIAYEYEQKKLEVLVTRRFSQTASFGKVSTRPGVLKKFKPDCKCTSHN